MPSFDAVNYSLRPSKSIQRQLVFDGVRILQRELDLERLAYVGLGSIWFTDFVMAHKLLGIDDMVSIEGDPVGYRRAVFNCPYATVRVQEGYSSEVLPNLYDDEVIGSRPWMMWMDYDFEFNESVRDDIRSVIEKAPMNSLLLVTFNGQETRYGQAADRPERLRDLFGSLVPAELPKSHCRGERMQETLVDFTIDFMKSVAAEIARPGGFVPAFRLIYRDTVPMVTAGGVLPSRGAVRITSDLVAQDGWPCRPRERIVAPHLTIREAAVLQSLLPRTERLSRDLVCELGFDLEDEQIAAFERYYRQYPAYAQIMM
jgi:hypothetical protein